MRSISKRALLLAVLAGAGFSTGEVFAKERRSSNGNSAAMQLPSNKAVMPLQVMKYNQTPTTSAPIVRDHRVAKPLVSSSASGGVTVTTSPRVRKTTKSGGTSGVQIPGTNVTVKPIVPKLPFGVGSSGGSSTTTNTTTVGGTVIRDHRKPVISIPPVANGGGGVTVTQSPTNKPTTGRPKPFGIPPLTNGSGNGGVTVTGTPVIRDHRDKGTTGPLGLPLGGLGGKLGTTTGPIIRDHRDPKIPPLSNGQGGGGVTVTPTKPSGPFGNIGDVLGQNGGPVIRDHRDDKTPWNPTGPFTPPPLGTGGTGKPPKDPFPSGPFNPFPGGKPPVADPGDPVTPPMDPGNNPPSPPPADPMNPPTPPMDDKHCHDKFCWPNFGFGYGGGFGGWGYGGGVVTQPIYVTQPVVSSPVYVEQPAAEVATADASITVEPTDLTKVEAGATITINGKDFGKDAGRVGMALGEVLLSAKVVNWTDTAVTIMVPQMDLAVPGKAKFLVLRPDGSLATELTFILMPAAVK